MHWRIGLLVIAVTVVVLLFSPMADGATLAGYVVDYARQSQPSTRGIASAEVIVSNASGQVVGRTSTAADGHYTVGGITDQKVFISCSKPSYSPHPRIIKHDVTANAGNVRDIWLMPDTIDAEYAVAIADVILEKAKKSGNSKETYAKQLKVLDSMGISTAGKTHVVQALASRDRTIVASLPQLRDYLNVRPVVTAVIDAKFSEAAEGKNDLPSIDKLKEQNVTETILVDAAAGQFEKQALSAEDRRQFLIDIERSGGQEFRDAVTKKLAGFKEDF